MLTSTRVKRDLGSIALSPCDDRQADLAQLRSQTDFPVRGEQMYALMAELFPICRSITGDGFRQTQQIIRKHLPDLELRAVPSGAKCFDWTVPAEWNIRDAYILDPNGQKIVDFRKCNLHVVNYSTPFDAKMSLDALRPHLHTIPEKPELIPYRTSYYQRDWGFCLTQKQYDELSPGTYRVVIDSSLDDNGSLNYGEYFLPGETDEEVLLSAHACHPSLCNDNLSGIVVATYLAKCLASVQRKYSYRFLFLPGGIGSVVWLCQNQHQLDRIKHGLVLTCLGDPADFTYKKTRSGNTVIDQAVVNVLKNSGKRFRVIDFSPYGYDERNFNSCKFQLPVGSLSRSQYGEYYGYHSSGDNLELMSAERLGESLEMYLSVLDVLDRNAIYLNTIPEAEPQLGKRGLYGMKGGLQGRDRMELVFLWLMNLSDGHSSLLDISDRSGYPFEVIRHGAEILADHGLLHRID